MKTLEDLLNMTVKSTDKDGNDVRITPEFRISVQAKTDECGIRVIIHANGHDIDTLDFVVTGNELVPL